MKVMQDLDICSLLTGEEEDVRPREHAPACAGPDNSIKKRHNVGREVKITFATSDQKECA